MPIIKSNGKLLEKVRTPRDSNLAGGVFNYDFYYGSDGTGIGNSTFVTTRKFVADDGSLQVFKNGEYMYKDINYIAIDNQTIQFIDVISPSDKIVLFVNGGSIVRDGTSQNFNNIVQLAGDMYVNGVSTLNNLGNKHFGSGISVEGLLSPVKAVVGTNGTHADLQSAINAVSAGALILVDTGSFNLSGSVSVNKNDLTIMGCGRGTVFNGNGTFAGLNILNQGVKIKGIKFNDFTTAIKVSSENCMILENYFSSNTVDVDYSGVSKIEIESNISE